MIKLIYSNYFHLKNQAKKTIKISNTSAKNTENIAEKCDKKILKINASQTSIPFCGLLTDTDTVCDKHVHRFLSVIFSLEHDLKRRIL